MAYNNLYREVANPLFVADGVDYRRSVLPPDPHGYLPNDLVAPYESAHRLANEEPLTARDVRSALWLCAGDIPRAAQRLGVPSARVRAFADKSAWVREELHEARERILEWRVLAGFWPKKADGGVCNLYIGCPAGTMFEEGDFAHFSRGMRRARNVPFPARPPPPVPSSAAIWRERAALRLCRANSVSALSASPK